VKPTPPGKFLLAKSTPFAGTPKTLRKRNAQSSRLRTASHLSEILKELARCLQTKVRELGVAGISNGQQRYQVVVCIAGQGFSVRREDMEKMLLATRGKVFTLRTLDRLVECSDLRCFKTK
jgi:hypothetical protein